MILLPTNLVFRRFVGSFVLSCSTNDAAACAEDPRAQLATLQTHTGGTAWGRIRDEWGGQNRVKKASAPFLVEKTHAPSSAMPFAVPPPASPYARTDTPLRIPHSASSQFRLPLYLQFIYPLCLCVKEKPFLPSPVNRAALIVSYIRVVSK